MEIESEKTCEKIGEHLYIFEQIKENYNDELIHSAPLCIECCTYSESHCENSSVEADEKICIINTGKGNEHMTPEQFLQIERTARPDFDEAEKKSAQLFDETVSRWGEHWKGYGSFRLTTGKHGLALHFQLPTETRDVAIFSLRAEHEHGNFNLKGPDADRERRKLSEYELNLLDTMYENWRSLPDNEGQGTKAITLDFANTSEKTLDQYLDVATDIAERWLNSKN